MRMICIGIDRAVGRRAMATIRFIDASSRLARVADASPSRCVRREVEKKRKHPFVERSRARGRRAKTLLTLEDEWTNARIHRVDAMPTR